jgi:hypothetical protein
MYTGDITKTSIYSEILTYRKLRESYDSETEAMRDFLLPHIEKLENKIIAERAKLPKEAKEALTKALVTNIYGQEHIDDKKIIKDYTKQSAVKRELEEKKTISNDYNNVAIRADAIKNRQAYEDLFSKIIDYRIFAESYKNDTPYVTSLLEPIMAKKQADINEVETKLTTQELNILRKAVFNYVHNIEDKAVIAESATGTKGNTKVVTPAKKGNDKTAKVANGTGNKKGTKGNTKVVTPAKKENDKAAQVAAAGAGGATAGATVAALNKAKEADKTISVSKEDVKNIKDNAKKEEPKNSTIEITDPPKKAKKNIWKRIALGIVSAGALVAVTIGAMACHRNSKEGTVNNNSITSSTTDTTSKNTTSVADTSSTSSNVDYSKMSFQELLNATTDTTKHNMVQTISDYYDYFNGDFANRYTKTGIQDKFALSWNEITAQYLRLNNFSAEEVEKLFDTYNFDDNDFMNYYKTGNLQLIGALIAERSDTPVKLDALITSEDGKALYNKYNDNMIAMNEALDKGDIAEATRLDAEFYNMVNEDLPELTEDNTYGAVHNNRSLSDNYKSIADIYVAAHRIAARNLNPNLWTDDFIAKFNDSGICNEVKNIYQNIEEDLTCYRHSLECCGKDATMAPYELLMEAKEKAMTINLDLRDWTKFVTIDADEFNKTCTESGYGNVVIQGYTGCTTTAETEQHSETSTTYSTSDSSYTTSDRNQAVAAAGEKAVEDAEAKANEATNAENAQAKAAAEAAAEKARQEAQAKADAETAQKQKEVDSDNAKTESEISNITDGTDSTSSNITIDPDDKGDISNATTDSTGAVDDNTPLPDPNSTGAEFDNEATDSTSTTNETNQNITESEEPILGSSQTNEEKAEAIVNSWANSVNSMSEDTAKVLSK